MTIIVKPLEFPTNYDKYNNKHSKCGRYYIQHNNNKTYEFTYGTCCECENSYSPIAACKTEKAAIKCINKYHAICILNQIIER